MVEQHSVLEVDLKAHVPTHVTLIPVNVPFPSNSIVHQSLQGEL